MSVRRAGSYMTETLLIWRTSRWSHYKLHPLKVVALDWCMMTKDTSTWFPAAGSAGAEVRSDKYFSRTCQSMSSTRWLKIWTRLSLEQNQGRSWFSSGLVRLREAYAFLLRSLAWLVNKSLCFGMICCSMLIPWCESLHAQSWVGQASKQGLCIHFGLKLTLTALHGNA